MTNKRTNEKPLMKTTQALLAILLFAPAFILAPLSFASSVPLPLCIFYGQAFNGYGWPYRSDADVVLCQGSNEITRCRIDGSIDPGVNFMLSVHLHDGAVSNAYVPYALRAGDVVSVFVEDAFGRKTIMESNSIPPVGNAGDIIHIQVTAGNDTDGDGMADDFEREMLAYSTDPEIDSIEEILPDDDFDGDGVSNRDEYHAGTFAFLDYDYFFTEHFNLTSNGRLHIQFLSVPGKVYTIWETTNLMAAAWNPCSYAQTETGALSSSPKEGNGNWMSLYVPITAESPIMRLQVQ